MAVNSVSNMINSKLRVSGLATGLDTDQIISNLMKAERVPLDKLMQKRQLAEWKSDAYRDITNLLRGLKDQYFDVLKPSSYMLSQTSYKKFTASSSDSTVVSASGGASASVGTHKIKVTNLAEAAVMKSSGTVTRALESSEAVTTGLDSDVVNASGKKIRVTIDGVTKEVTLGNYTDACTLDDFAVDLQNRISMEFGTGKVNVDVTADNKLAFTTVGGASRITLENGSTDSALGYLNIGTGSTNRINITDTLDTLRTKLNIPFGYKTAADGTQNVVLTINSRIFTFSKDTTLSSMMSTINGDEIAKVNMAYDDVTDKFIITSKQSGSGNNIQISEDTSTFLGAVNFKSFTASQAASLSYSDEKFQVSIDGTIKEFTLNGTYASQADLALDMQTRINNAFTGNSVTVSADSNGVLSFRLDTGSVMAVSALSPETSALGFKNANYTMGEDAKITLDGQEITRSSNMFTVNGVNYTLLKESSTEQTVSLNLDVDTVYNNIKGFVDKYNEVIKTINDKMSEKYDRDYQPLTDEQRESMSDDDIKKWEDKAKTGILRNDSLLQGIVYSMREALFDNVSGVATNLTDIGISTGDYSEKGKLVIDEDKLKAAIQADPDGVMNLFGKQSASYSLSSRNYTSEERKTRYNEEGLAYRIFDIIEDNISTFRDNNDRKGLLLQAAGITGDSSEYSNTIYDEIRGYDKQITELSQKLIDKEDNYYEKYAQLETLMSQMNAQSSWLSSQLGQGS